MNVNNDIHQRYSEVDLLSTQGRIGRRTYFVFSVLLPFISVSILASIAGIIARFSSASNSSLANTLAYILLGLAFVTLISITVRLTIQRCHDFNKSGWAALFALIPFANIIYALIPGNNGLNSYGEPPEPPSSFVKTGVILIALLLAGLLGFLLFKVVSLSTIADSIWSLVQSML